MRKKYLSALLFGALLVTSAGTFTSCKDYDDDINSLQEQILANADAIKKLQSLVESGDYVTNVEKTAEGLVITFKNAGPKTLDLSDLKGEDGEDGKNGSVVAVDADGELTIDGEKTGIKVAEDETKIQPSIIIGENNCWEVLQEDGTYKNTNIPVSGASLVKNENNEWELTVIDANGEKQTVKLPTASSLLSEVEIVGLLNEGSISNSEGYGVPSGTDNASSTYIRNFFNIITEDMANTDAVKEWNKEAGVKQLTKGKAISSIDSYSQKLLIRIAPATLDAADLSFSLVNSQLKESPITLGEPEAYEGLLTLTRAKSLGNGLWVLPVDINVEGKTYNDVDEYLAQFGVEGKDYTWTDNDGVEWISRWSQKILCGLKEANGFVTGFDVSVEAYQRSAWTTVKVDYWSNNSIHDVIDYMQCNEIGLGTQTIGFVAPEYVYDAHLHIDDATVSRWGIKDINGTSFTVTKRPDNVTVANFVVEVHYVCLDGTVRTAYVPYRVGKSYANVTTLDSKNILITKDNSKNVFEASLDKMFTDLGENVAVWKADVESKVVGVYKVGKNGEDDELVSDITVKFDNDDLSKITKLSVSLDDYTKAYDINSSYYAKIEFKEGNDVLNTVKAPFTLSIPALSEYLVKEQVVFGGTNNGTGVMNLNDYAAFNGTPAYSFKYAFVGQLSKLDSDVKVTFEIDANQTVSATDKTKMTDVAKIQGTGAAQALVLTDKTKAYNNPININVKEAKYLGIYEYSKDVREDFAFTMKVVSPIKEGNIIPADGANAIITVVATADGTAKISESDLKATTYAGIAYKIFPAYPETSYVKDNGLSFKSENENVFTIGEIKSSGSKNEGYVIINPMNVAYEDAVPVKITVTDKWGYTKEAKINVKVKPSVE